MLRYITTICFCLMLSKMGAQVPGYQGKKMLVEISENMYRFPLNIFQLPKVAKDIRFKTGLYVEYVVGRKSAWALDYEWLGQYTSIQNYNATIGNKICTSTFKHTYNHFGAKYIHYTRAKWCLAPMGRYWSLGMVFIPSNNIQTEDSGVDCKSPYTNFRTRNLFASIGYGSRTILWDRASVNFGVQANVPLPTFLYDVADTSNNAPLGGSIKSDIIINNFFKVYLNIGLLAF